MLMFSGSSVILQCPHQVLRGRDQCLSDERTKVQRGQATCLRSHSLGCELESICLQLPALPTPPLGIPLLLSLLSTSNALLCWGGLTRIGGKQPFNTKLF